MELNEPLNKFQLLELVQKLKAKAEAVATKYRRVAENNERFFTGDQLGFTDVQAGKFIDATDTWKHEDTPYQKINLITNALLAWNAVITDGRPSVKAYPASAEIGDVYSAEIANEVIQYLREDIDETECIKQLTRLGLTHGTAALKVIYDDNDQAVRWAPLAVDQYLVDPVKDYRDAKYCLFSRHVDIYEAAAILAKSNVAPKMSMDELEQHLEHYQNKAGDELEGIEIMELWHRGACKGHPNGFFAAYMGDLIIEYMPEYPYILNYKSKEYAPLPLVVFKVIEQKDSAYGLTQFTDACNIQRQYNETCSRITNFTRDTSKAHLVLPLAMAEKWADLSANGETSVIGLSDEQLSKAGAIRYTEMPNIATSLLDQREFLEQKLYEVLGINESVVGTDTRVRSGKALERIASLDKQKNAQAGVHLEKCILDAWRLTLALVQAFYAEPRKINITNDKDGVKTLSFSGADLAGADVRLETASSTEQRSDSVELSAQEQLGAGFIDKPKYDSLLKSPEYALAKAKIEQIISAYLDDASVQFDSAEIDPQLVIAAVNAKQADSILQGNRLQWLDLESLKKQLMAVPPEAALPAPEEELDQVPIQEQEGVE